ncbi:MAG: methyltransferase domain-containing protein [Sulfuricella sp.]|nr:methyltransferase domain-containing protein [Sulfuricella sp.]
MKQSALAVYRCPVSGGALRLEDAEKLGEEVNSGTLLTADRRYPIEKGMPVFAATEQLAGTARFARNYYASIADSYDENVHVTFDLFNESELEVRLSMINLLNLNPHSKVLEISAGTGKDSELIAKRLDESGELWLLDISPDMLVQAKAKIRKYPARTEAAIGDACHLPYGDDYFDALYCFSGIGHFNDQKAALKEMARVVRPGGRVVFLEKNVPPWLRDTEYGKILINNNPMFADPDPLALIPVEARNVGIRWILGNAHYVVDYTVGTGAPVGNFDLELPSYRGGSFNTRYFGKVEGITKESKALYEKAAKKCGMSLHEWLDSTIKEKALKDLG